jgi:hypothetical protein
MLVQADLKPRATRMVECRKVVADGAEPFTVTQLGIMSASGWCKDRSESGISTSGSLFARGIKLPKEGPSPRNTTNPK